MDEANLVIPSRLFGKLKPFVLSFLAESRKLNCDIFFTTQHPSRVEKVLRELTEEWVGCIKIPILGWIYQQHETLSAEGKFIETTNRALLVRKSKYWSLYNTRHIVGMDSDLMPDIKIKNNAIFDALERFFSSPRYLMPNFVLRALNRIKSDFKVVGSDILSLFSREKSRVGLVPVGRKADKPLPLTSVRENTQSPAGEGKEKGEGVVFIRSRLRPVAAK